MMMETFSTMTSPASQAAAAATTAIPYSANPASPPAKKRRNLPGMPDPNADVVSLSPESLMATNRFICEVCGKGFQRDQNLQLHRRGHDLPWKLRQRNAQDEVRRKVYVCPEPSCVHHHPSRALGDLTGIKKHYSRKHGEKKWKCERCAKKYAVMSDCKAHMKTCGSRQYKCDCGTLFSRRDSFTTHRAFCDALNEENTKVQTAGVLGGVDLLEENLKDEGEEEEMVKVASSPPPPSPITPAATAISSVLSIHSPDIPDLSAGVTEQISSSLNVASSAAATSKCSNSSSYISGKTRVFASIFAPYTATPTISYSHALPPASQPDNLFLSSVPKAEMGFGNSRTYPSLYLSGNSFSLFPTVPDPLPDHNHYAPISQQPSMSATALLQKAAQMGATASSSSLLCGFSLAMPPTSSSHEVCNADTPSTNLRNSSCVETDNSLATAGLGLGLGLGLGFSSTDLYGQPTTLDLLGLGLGTDSSPPSRLSAFLNSMGGGIEDNTANPQFQDIGE